MIDPLVVATFLLVVATFGLVGITAYYAFQTRSTVSEMRKARGQAVFPRLKADMAAKGAGNGWLRVTNVGPGSALDVVARLQPEPGGLEIVWRTHVIANGDGHQFLVYLPGATQPTYTLDDLTTHYTHVRLQAEYRDALGESQSVDERIEIREWWAALKAAHHLLPKDWTEEQTREIEKIRREVEKLTRATSKIADRDDPRPWKWDLRIRRLPAGMQPRARAIAARLGLLNY
jgi:hypothetical protein